MKRKRNLMVAVALAVLVLVSSAAIAGSKSSVYDFLEVRQSGKSTLARTSSGISYTFQAKGTGLFPGYTYTMWVVVFNEPENCTDPCSADDIFVNPIDPKTDVLWGKSGKVVNENGTIHLRGKRAAGDNSDSVYEDVFGLGPWFGLINPLTAEIHLVLRSHGPASADPDVLEQQITTFLGGCTNLLNPEDNFPGVYTIAVEDGDCVDTQFAIHVP